MGSRQEIQEWKRKIEDLRAWKRELVKEMSRPVNQSAYVNKYVKEAIWVFKQE